MRRRNVIVDSEDESDADSDTSPKPSPKRKRGRPPKAKNKKQRVQDDSDDDAPTQPSAAQNGRGASSPDSDDNAGSDDDNSGSSSNYTPVIVRATKQKNTTQRKAAIRVRGVNRLPSSDDSDSGFPQPSTSNATNGTAEEESESESSGSETPDSDYGPINDRNSPKKKAQKRGRKPGNAKRQKLHNGVHSSNKSLNHSHQNTSSRKNSKLSQSASSAITFDPKIVESLAQKLVYFLLIEDQRKYAIKRKAIVASVFKDENYSPKLYLAVINKANTVLKKTYGMELMELENQKDSYLIVNIMRRELGIHDFVEMSRLKQQQSGLILYIVTVIFMNDNVITEDELTKSLKVVGIDLTSKKVHPIFGDAKKYITVELVKQMYLDYKRVSKEPLRYEFTWGLRAKQEFDKTDLLQFACEIMDDTAPEDWRIQFKDAEKSARPSS